MNTAIASNDLTALATKINAQHEHAIAAAKTAIQYAKEAGDLLLQAKAKCRHGEWLHWLNEHVRFSERTARAYMQVARRWPEIESKTAETADLSIDAALNLLAESKTENGSCPGDASVPPLESGRGYLGWSEQGDMVEIWPMRSTEQGDVFQVVHMLDMETGGLLSWFPRGIMRAAVAAVLVHFQFSPVGGWRSFPFKGQSGTLTGGWLRKEQNEPYRG